VVLQRLKESGLSSDSQEGQKAAIDLFTEAIRQFTVHPDLKNLYAGVWLPTTFALLDEPFTEANGFINSTMKMVRWKIIRHYQERIDHLYTPKGKDPFNDLNREAVRRLGEAGGGA
jgi:long-chain acyl-CoA synthetase